MPLALFEAMARWYFGGSPEKEPPQYRRDDNIVVVSDAWFGILCLSYFGNGPRHQSVGSSGGLQGAMDVPKREEVVQYAEIRKTPQMVQAGMPPRRRR